MTSTTSVFHCSGALKGEREEREVSKDNPFFGHLTACCSEHPYTLARIIGAVLARCATTALNFFPPLGVPQATAALQAASPGPYYLLAGENDGVEVFEAARVAENRLAR